MKKYLLFVGDNYYPKGGMDDFAGIFDTVEDAMEKGEEGTPYKDGSGYSFNDWYHIVEHDTMNLILRGEREVASYSPTKYRFEITRF
jgi:hypothetical protein